MPAQQTDTTTRLDNSLFYVRPTRKKSPQSLNAFEVKLRIEQENPTGYIIFMVTINITLQFLYVIKFFFGPIIRKRKE